MFDKLNRGGYMILEKGVQVTVNYLNVLRTFFPSLWSLGSPKWGGGHMINMIYFLKLTLPQNYFSHSFP